MKFLITLAFLGVLIATVTSEGSVWGSRQPGDRMLDYTHIHTKGSIPMKKAVMDVEYKGSYNITQYIRAIDNKGGGNASILTGGVGSKFAKLHLKSARGKSLSFTVEIFGR